MLSLGLVGAVGTALIYLVGGNFAINGDFSTGQLVTFPALVPLIYQPLTALTGARVDIMTALVSFEHVFEVLDTPHGIKDSRMPQPLTRLRVRSDLSLCASPTRLLAPHQCR